MKFSIIVPVYNAEQYLRKCIDSILVQTYQDFEVVLIDDGSTDNSGGICDEYAAHYPMIRVIHQKNQGPSAARNAGLDVVRGDWVAFVDSDDWIETDMLEILLKHIEQDHAELYCFNAQKVSEDGVVRDSLIYFPENNSTFLRSEEQRFQYFFSVLMQYKVGWESCFRIFRRDLIQEIGLRFSSMDEVYAEDYLFVFQYLLRVKKISVLCNVLYNYRQHGASLMHTKNIHTVIPRLYQWAEAAYRDICVLKFRDLKKKFYLLYFMLLNYHIQYTLRNLSSVELESAFSQLQTHRKHKNWMRQLEKSKVEVEQYMVETKWL